MKKYLSKLAYALVLVLVFTTNSFNVLASTNDNFPNKNKITYAEFSKQIKRLEKKYQVTMQIPDEKTFMKLQASNNQVSQSELNFNSFSEIENYLANATKNSRKSTNDIVYVKQNTNNKYSIALPELPQHYHYQKWTPYDPNHLTGSVFTYRHIEFDYDYTSMSSGITSVSNITSYSTGLNAASWDHKSGYYSRSTTNYYNDTVTVTATGIWSVGLTGYGIPIGTSWSASWSCTVCFTA